MAANDADGPTDDHLDTEAERERLLTRRDALVGGAAGLSAIALSSQISGFVDTVTAQVQEDNRQMWLGQRFVADASGDDVRLVHQATGAELRYDENQGLVLTRDQPLLVGEEPWEVQVDGQDADGVINLETGDLPSASIAVRDSSTSLGAFEALDFGDGLSATDDGSAARVDATGGVGGDAEFDSVTTEELNTVPQVREQATSGSGTKADPFVVPSDILDSYHALLNFGSGWFEADGLETDGAFDYAEESVYLEGDGIRTTTLHHSADTPTTPTVLIQGVDGNFGGIRDMTVYGAGENDTSGSANIIESDGSVIDLQIENVIARYGGGDAIHLKTSASGTRLRNLWVENCNKGVFIENSQRVKIDNIHGFSSDIFMDIDLTRSSVANVSCLGAGDHGLNVGGRDNSLSNIYVEDAGNTWAILSGSYRSQWANVAIRDTAFGMQVSGGIPGSNVSNLVLKDITNQGLSLNNVGRHQVSNVWAEDVGSWVVDISGGSNCQVNGVVAWNDDGTNTDLIRIQSDNDNNVFKNVWADPSVDWTIEVQSGATDNAIHGPWLNWSNVTDNGTRTVLNGVGLNAGDPSSTGDWNGNGYEGLTVRDTSNSNTYLYNNGSWSQIASS